MDNVLMRARLRERIQQLRCCINTSNQNDLQVFPLSIFTGYTLSNFSTEVRGKETEFEAWCRGQFRFAVTIEDGQICKMDIALTQYSTFREIETDLDKLCQGLCPNIVLMTIQQYTHMSAFRKEVLNKLLTSKFFRFYEPENKDGSKACNICTIRGYHSSACRKEVVVEISWTISWHKCCQALAHKFTVLKKDDRHLHVQNFLSALDSKVFHRDNHEILWDKWVKFCSALANYNQCNREC